MFEHGLQRRIFLRLFNRKLSCEGNISHFSGIGTVEIRFIVRFFIAGIVTSLVILLLEIVVDKTNLL